jgi:FAD/FMN-containing dehydrogenase
MQYCYTNHLPIVPHGGNTGLCGGATPYIPHDDDNDTNNNNNSSNSNNSSSISSYNEIILSLEYMNNIYNIDIYSGILTCDAGSILSNLHDYAKQHDHLFPLDIGSKGSCQIGGNVATNAGGQYFNRFGGLHSTVVGMEVVLPSGKVMTLNMQQNNTTNVDNDDSSYNCPTKEDTKKTNTFVTNRKDNTGYDIKHLFIGSEGTLGIITKVAIACPPTPSTKNVVLLVCESYEYVLQVLQCAKSILGEILSALELMDYNTLKLVQKYYSSGGDSRLLDDILLQSKPSSHDIQQESEKALRLFSSSPSRPVYLLVEAQGSNIEHDSAKMNTFLTHLHTSSIITNGYLAQNYNQVSEMWSIRESCNPCVAKAGCVYKFDISIPVEEYMDITYEIESKLRTNDYCSNMEFTVCVWGHVNDGNAHINIVTPGQPTKNSKLAIFIEDIVYDSVIQRYGSISAEHGLGQSKNEVMGRYKDRTTLDVMQQIKDMFDPHGIMNPGKYLPRRT